jgi:hypothetical protein
MRERSERTMNTVSFSPRTGDGIVGAARRGTR